MNELITRTLRGKELQSLLPALADLRIAVFREFPYLYEGSAEYEERYLQKYADSPDSVIVVVYDGKKIVGASSGLPLVDEAEEMRAPFEQQGWDLDSVFYCGESVLLPSYRGRGLGVKFFEEREKHARSMDRFGTITFCAVQRPDNHPRKPENYQPLDSFWRKRGYERRPELLTHYRWQDIDDETETAKPMVFWMKRL